MVESKRAMVRRRRKERGRDVDAEDAVRYLQRERRRRAQEQYDLSNVPGDAACNPRCVGKCACCIPYWMWRFVSECICCLCHEQCSQTLFSRWFVNWWARPRGFFHDSCLMGVIFVLVAIVIMPTATGLAMYALHPYLTWVHENVVLPLITQIIMLREIFGVKLWFGVLVFVFLVAVSLVIGTRCCGLINFDMSAFREMDELDDDNDVDDEDYDSGAERDNDEDGDNIKPVENRGVSVLVRTAEKVKKQQKWREVMQRFDRDDPLWKVVQESVPPRKQKVAMSWTLANYPRKKDAPEVKAGSKLDWTLGRICEEGDIKFIVLKGQ